MEPHSIIYNYPMKFPKINTLWKRDPLITVKRKGIIQVGKYSEEAFKTIRLWKASEKINGENIRIFIIPGTGSTPIISILGRKDTDTPQINEKVIEYIDSHLTPEALKRAFTKDSSSSENLPRLIMIFGEGFGGDIKHGHNYRDSPEFIVFDIIVDNWWLEYNNVANISKKLGFESVPLLPGHKTTEEIVDYVKGQPKSITANKPHLAEGVVCTSVPLLLTRQGYPVRFKLKSKDFRDLESVAETDSTEVWMETTSIFIHNP